MSGRPRLVLLAFQEGKSLNMLPTHFLGEAELGKESGISTVMVGQDRACIRLKG